MFFFAYLYNFWLSHSDIRGYFIKRFYTFEMPTIPRMRDLVQQAIYTMRGGLWQLRLSFLAKFYRADKDLSLYHPHGAYSYSLTANLRKQLHHNSIK